MNCSEIRSVTSSLFIHRLFAFCRHSPQLILRLYYVSSRPSAVGKLRRTVADQPGVDWFGQHLRVYRDQSGGIYFGWFCPECHSTGRNKFLATAGQRSCSSLLANLLSLRRRSAS